MKKYIGIDPGKVGAIGVIECNGMGVLSNVIAVDTPIHTASKAKGKGKKSKSAYDISGMVNLLRGLKVDATEMHVYIEKVHSMPGQGVCAVFDFGEGFGIWQGILAALHIPHTLITPQRWKKAMLADIGAEKAASRIRAGQLFPDYAPLFARVRDDGRAEALLMAEYGRRLATA